MSSRWVGIIALAAAVLLAFIGPLGRGPAIATRDRALSMVAPREVVQAPVDAGRSGPAASAPAKTSRDLARFEPASAAREVTGEPKPPTSAAPAFDIVRVEPSGDTLLAGRTKPNGTVALTDRGIVVAETKADEAGNFLMTPPLQPGDHALGLRDGLAPGAGESAQTVVVSVPRSKTEPVGVALAEPGRPTQILTLPPAPTTAPVQTATLVPRATVSPPPAEPDRTPSPIPQKLAIRSVELENGSGLFASGVAPPGADVRLYLNDSRVADVIAAAAGAWSVKVRKGLSAGRYAVRADSVKADQSVSSRVEVPFDVPLPMGGGRSGVPPATSPVSPTAPEAGRSPPAVVANAVVPPRVEPAALPTGPQIASPNDAAVDEIHTELVIRGDNLWRISRNRLGHGTRYTQIYAANSTQIRDPKLIYPGQVFVMPRD